MKFLKKLIPVCLLALVLVVGITLLTPKAQAATSGTCGYNLTWKLDDNGTLTISGTGAMSSWSYYSSVPWYNSCSSIKSVVIEPGVTTIGDLAFFDCTSLTSVTIGDSVTTIGDSAFNGCSSLQSITIPDSVTTIDYAAFAHCSSLTSVTIGDSVTAIGGSAFSGCTSLQSVTIPDSVTTIDYCAFQNCWSLTSVTIGDSVTTIGEYAFESCLRLTDVYYAGTQSQWNGIAIGRNNSYLTDATIHYGHTHNYTTLTVAPTCTEPGYIEYTCVHGESYREVLAPAHDYTIPAETIVPTCTERGYTIFACARCGMLGDGDYVPALGHDHTIEVETVAPTCTEQGCTIFACVRCGMLAERNFVSSLGHDYSGAATVIAPTCTQQGYTETQCIRCTATEISDHTTSLGHNVVVISRCDPTCTEPGVSKIGTMCDRCQEVFIEPTYIPALGHNFVDGVCAACMEENPDYVRGDLTGDNYLNNADVMALMWHVLFPETHPISDTVDYDHNGQVDNDDVIALMWYILFPELYPLP